MDEFGNYATAIRTFWLKAEGLTATRQYQAVQVGEQLPVSIYFENAIRGTSSSEDEVTIIGDDRAVQEFSFLILPSRRVGSGEADGGPEAEITKFLKVPEDVERYLEERTKIYHQLLEQFDSTATLGFLRSDRESGTPQEWYVQCWLEKKVFAALHNDICNGKVGEIEMGLHWISGLVADPHAPPSAATTWGLLPEHEVMFGFPTSINWALRSET